MKAIFDIVEKFLRNTEDTSAIWDSDAVVWVDWREYDEDIISYFITKFNDKIIVESVNNGKEYGNDIILKIENNSMQIPYNIIMERDITITYLNEFLTPKYEIRWFMKSLGDDTLGFVSLTKDMWVKLEHEFGEINVCHYFEPITLGKRMFSLDMDEVSTYIKLRDNNQHIFYIILLELLNLVVSEKKLRLERKIGNIDLKTFAIENNSINKKIEKIVKEHKIIL